MFHAGQSCECMNQNIIGTRGAAKSGRCWGDVCNGGCLKSPDVSDPAVNGVAKARAKSSFDFGKAAEC